MELMMKDGLFSFTIELSIPDPLPASAIHGSQAPIIGFIGITSPPQIFYILDEEYWGRGYATDAVRTLANFGFQRLGLHRITAAIGPDNAASVSVVKRAGFTHEGRLRDHVFTNGAWRDSLLFSMLVHEWPGITP